MNERQMAGKIAQMLHFALMEYGSGEMERPTWQGDPAGRRLYEIIDREMIDPKLPQPLSKAAQARKRRAAIRVANALNRIRTGPDWRPAND